MIINEGLTVTTIRVANTTDRPILMRFALPRRRGERGAGIRPRCGLEQAAGVLSGGAERFEPDAENACGVAPVLPLSRKRAETVEKLCDWVRRMQESFASGGQTRIDPGPMAPHHRAHDHGHPHSHRPE